MASGEQYEPATFVAAGGGSSGGGVRLVDSCHSLHGGRLINDARSLRGT